MKNNVNFVSKELEASILNRCIVDKTAFSLVCNILSHSDFYFEVHQLIYKTIEYLDSKGFDVDWLSIREEIKNFDDFDILDIANVDIPIDYQIEFGDIVNWATIVSDLKKRRSFIADYQSLSLKVMDNKKRNHELLDALSEIGKGLSSKTGSDIKTNSDLSNELRADFRNAQSGIVVNTPLTGTDIDKYLTVADGELIIIAARPGMGKSMLSNTIACHCGHVLKKKVVVWSLEMSAKEYAMMSISNLGDINYTDMRSYKIDYSKSNYLTAEERFRSSDITIIDRTGVDIGDVEAQASYLKHKGVLDILIIDHGKLLKFNPNNLRVEVGDASSRLKALAKKLGIPIVMLWQLSREVERSPNCIPQLRHLQESGNLEQDADRVIMLLRPEYYAEEGDPMIESVKGLAKVYCRKYRGGQIGEVDTTFNPIHARFQNRQETFLRPMPKPMERFNVSANRKGVEEGIPF